MPPLFLSHFESSSLHRFCCHWSSLLLRLVLVAFASNNHLHDDDLYIVVTDPTTAIWNCSATSDISPKDCLEFLHQVVICFTKRYTIRFLILLDREGPYFGQRRSKLIPLSDIRDIHGIFIPAPENIPTITSWDYCRSRSQNYMLVYSCHWTGLKESKQSS